VLLSLYEREKRRLRKVRGEGGAGDRGRLWKTEKKGEAALKEMRNVFRCHDLQTEGTLLERQVKGLPKVRGKRELHQGRLGGDLGESGRTEGKYLLYVRWTLIAPSRKGETSSKVPREDCAGNARKKECLPCEKGEERSGAFPLKIKPFSSL